MKDKEVEEALFKIMDTIKTTKLLPINISRDTMTTERKPILVIDINTLMSDYQAQFVSTEELERFFCEKYNCNVLFLDCSRHNVQGNVTPIKPYYI
jgi:hypothetical protein